MPGPKEGNLQDSDSTISEKPEGTKPEIEEPVDESTQRWRETVEGTKSPYAIRRWYLRKEDNGEYSDSKSPTQPATVNVNEDWGAELPLEGVEIGHYRVALCITPRCTDLSSIETVTIGGIMKRKDDNYLIKPYDNSTLTVIPREEIYGFPPEQFTLLKLHRQVYYQADVASLRLDVSFVMENAGQGQNSPFMDIHYVEIEANQARPREDRDHVVYGLGKPTQVIRVGINNTPFTKPVEISAWAFSDSGEFAATLYFTEGLAHLDIWDLKSHNGKGPSSSPQVNTVPRAQAAFSVSKAFNDINPFSSIEVNMDISKFGSQVAICTDDQFEDGIPFQMFKWTPIAPVDHDPSQPWSLRRTTTICDNGFYTIFAYHSSDPLSTREEEERFCVCDGLSLSVYSTQGNWTLIYKLSMQQEFNFMAASEALDSLQGRYFAWMNTDGVISVWDFETGKLLSHILTGDDSAGNPELSLDGSMVAVTVSGTIQVYDTLTGIKLGVLREGLGEESDFDYAFGQDHLMISNVAESTISKPYKHDVRSIVNVRDMSIVKNYNIHEDYLFQTVHGGKFMIFSYREGSNLSLLLDKCDILCPTTNEDHCGVDGVCERKPINTFVIFAGCNHNVENTEGSKFILQCRVPLIAGVFVKELDVSVDNNGTDEEERLMSIPIGVDLGDCFAFFIPATSQLVYLSENYLMVWTLSTDGPRICELNSVWKIQENPPGTLPSDYASREILSAQVCEHGQNFRIELSKPKWFRQTLNYREVPGAGKVETLTMPISSEDTVSSSEDYRNTQGIAHLIEVYGNGGPECGEAIISYLNERIRPSPKYPVSSLATICSAWTVDNRGVVEIMIDNLLPSGRITWVPDSKSTKVLDPLAIILKHASENPIAIKVAKVIMNYCVTRANKSRNLAFLAPLFGSLYTVMDMFPEEALQQLGRIAYIPVKNRSYILDNHILVHQPQMRLQFWKPNNQPLSKTKYPIMQLHVSDETPDATNNAFTRPVFSASFDALWYYKDLKPLGSSGEARAEASDTVMTIWWKTIYHMIRLKCQFRAHTYVECYDFDLEFFDNPAIAALVAYKWNTIGYAYWMVRFIFQCSFYALVVIAAIMQVYYSEPSKLFGLFIVIIVMSVIFLWLELLQAVRGVSRYRKSQYNFIDIGVFLLPMAASINQLVLIYHQNPNGNNHSLSFSVLAVFVHMLFEMRVNKSVCKYTAIIQKTVSEIRVFFVVLAVGLFAFTISILHLLRGCPHEPCPERTTEFPNHPLGALSATYFFMGGRWDSVGTEFTTNQWAFHLMMGIFFFFTVIVMLNVLIALINKAFEKGDDGWRLIWIESRLRFIESAENMSYHIPGFRQTYNYFPKDIYYSATLQEVKEYREKHNISTKDKDEEDELDIAEDWLQDITGEDGYLDEETEDGEDEGNTENDGNGTNGTNDDDGDENEDEDADGANQEGTESATKDRDKTPKEKTQKDGKKKDKKDKKAGKTKGKKKGRKSEAGWTTDEEGENEDEGDDDEAMTGRRPSGAKDTKTIRRLNTRIENLNGQVGNLQTQIGDLQKQLTAQMAGQRQQAQRQRDDHQELKTLLMHFRPSSA